MDKERKNKKKELSNQYLEFFYACKRQIKEENLNYFANKDVENEAFDRVYESSKSSVEIKKALGGKDNRKQLEKMWRGKPRKTIIESVLDAIYHLGLCFAALLPFLYLVNVISKNDQAYNEGLLMCYKSRMLGVVIVLAVILLVMMTILTKQQLKDQAPKINLRTNLVFIAIFGILAIILFMLPEDTIIKLNFLIVFALGLIIGFGSFGIFYFISKKNYEKYKNEHKSEQ